MQLHRAICKVQLTLNTFMSQNSLLTVDYGPSVEFHHSVQKMSGQNVMANKFTRTCLWHHDIGNSMLISTLWNNWAIILSISLPQGSHSNVRIKISTFLDPFKHHFELKTILLIAKQDTATPMQQFNKNKLSHGKTICPPPIAAVDLLWPGRGAAHLVGLDAAHSASWARWDRQTDGRIAASLNKSSSTWAVYDSLTDCCVILKTSALQLTYWPK